MDMRPPHIHTEAQQTAHTDLKATAHQLTVDVHARNVANADGAAAAHDLAAYQSWHPEYKNADAKKRMRWNAILGLHVIAWICDAILVATFGAFLARLFSGGNFLLTIIFTVVFTLVLSIIGAALIIGVRILIDERRRERNIPSLRRWQAAGVIVSLIPLVLIFGVGFALAANHHFGSIILAVAQLHLLWIAIAATIATAVLVFSGDLGNTAKGFLLYKKTLAKKQAVINKKKKVYETADHAAVHGAMYLVEGTQSYTLTYGVKPILPPFDAEVVSFIHEKFPHALPAWNSTTGDDTINATNSTATNANTV
jgi:hypothetical protein